MELAKKLLIIPEDRMLAVEQLSDLDKKMENILKKKGLNESEKAALYIQALQKYVSHQLPSPKESTTTFDTLESQVMNAAPVRYKTVAKDIFHHARKYLTPQGELMLGNQTFPIASLISDFLRKRKKQGQNVFHQWLKDSHLPNELDVHHKLKPMVYAKKPRWVSMY